MKFSLMPRVAALIFAELVLTASLAQAQATPEPHVLRAPTGEYAVGTRIFHWTDTARLDPSTPPENDRRQLTVQLWYPTDATTGTRAPYVPDLEILRTAFSRGADALALLLAPAWIDAPLRRSVAPYPVIVFSHGMGNIRSFYTTLVAEWASRGYVVAMIDHPGMGLVAVPGVGVVKPYAPWTQAPPGLRAKTPEERDAYWSTGQIELSADQRFGRDQRGSLNMQGAGGPFTGRLDVTHVAEAGHSDGFLSRTCSSDPRIAACLNLDGVPALAERRNGLRVPYMIIRDGDDAPAVQEIFDTMHAPAYDVLVGGATHNASDDLPVLASAGDTTARRVFAEVVKYSSGFFDATLRRQPVQFLNVPLATPGLTMRYFPGLPPGKK